VGKLKVREKVQSSPKTTTLSKHMLQVGRLASSDEPYYSYAGGSLSCWQGHPTHTRERVGARLSVVDWYLQFGG